MEIKETKLNAIKRVVGKIKVESGLHIGAGDIEMRIGGVDNPVIKHPHTMEPYIPGSSLKGKVRSLLELRSGLMNKTGGEVISDKTVKNVHDPKLKKKAEEIIKIFGSSGAEKKDLSHYGPTRVSFSDCAINGEWRRKAREERWVLREEKTENSINRISGIALNPRSTERVPEGVEFDFLLTFKMLQGGDNKLFDVLIDGLKLLEMDSLGGNGSRGYGRISFIFTEDEKLSNDFENLDPFKE